MDNLIIIGEVTKQHGNKGELKVFPLTDFIERFDYLDNVFLCKGDETVKKQVEKVRYHKNLIIIKFNGIDNIAQAKTYRNYLLKIPVEEMVPLYEDQYYIFDLIDYKVYLPEGKLLGQVKDIKTTGGTDIFMISNGKKDYMIPAAKEFVTIDEESRKITVTPIPGLLDL